MSANSVTFLLLLSYDSSLFCQDNVFKDPSGNNLEFKAMTKIENLFAKYNVVDD